MFSRVVYWPPHLPALGGGGLAIISGSLLTQEREWGWRQAPVAVGPSEHLFAGVSSGMAQRSWGLSGATGSLRAKAVSLKANLFSARFTHILRGVHACVCAKLV